MSGEGTRERILILGQDLKRNAELKDRLRGGDWEVESRLLSRASVSVPAEEKADLVVADLVRPGEAAEGLLTWLRGRVSPPAFLVVTPSGAVSQALTLLREAADAFLTRPVDPLHLQTAVARALEHHRLRLELHRFRKTLPEGHFHGMVGTSRPMKRLHSQVRRLAGGRGPVLILGESGVGKELVARAIHREALGRGSPFIAVNCAGIPETLLESEFFGHVAGAFTGARRSRRGLFAEAEGGSLLLDEVADMPASLQAKLLRVLEDGKFRPVGSNRERSVKVRVLVATNSELEREVVRGGFREDLFFRLETFRIRVPALRERREDVPLLAEHFTRRFSLQAGKSIRRVSPEALEILQEYSFPGNVRELKNAIERAVTFCNRSELQVGHLPSRVKRREPLPLDGKEDRNFPAWDLQAGGGVPTLAEVERSYVRFVLDRVQGNKRRAAALLGIGRRTLYRRLRAGA